MGTVSSLGMLLAAFVGACTTHGVPPTGPAPARAPAPLDRPSPPDAGSPELSTAPETKPDPSLLGLDASVQQPPPPEPHPYQTPVSVPPGKSAPAMRYANLWPAGCQAELKKRKLPMKRAGGPAKGIATPLRFDGPLHGVRFVAPGTRSVYGKLDCRLALTLDDLAPLLAEHDVVEVRVDNMYRPRARLPGRRKPSQHSYGLAIDVVSFTLADGTVLDVEDDWAGAIGDKPCGTESSLVEPTENTVRLRNLVCEVARSGLFHHMLTPNYDKAHRDHVHMDIKRDEKRFIIE